MPREAERIHCEHVEAFIADLLDSFKPSTAANRYRLLQQFFKWLREEGEISVNPMPAAHKLLSNGMGEGGFMKIMGWSTPMMAKRGLGGSGAGDRCSSTEEGRRRP